MADIKRLRELEALKLEFAKIRTYTYQAMVIMIAIVFTITRIVYSEIQQLKIFSNFIIVSAIYFAIVITCLIAFDKYLEENHRRMDGIIKRMRKV